MTLPEASPCPFYSADGIILRNDMAYVDKNPVTAGHCLIMPFRHVADFFATTDEERMAMLALAEQAKAMLDRDLAPHLQ